MKLSHLLFAITLAAGCSIVSYQAALVRQQIRMVPAHIHRVVHADADTPVIKDRGQIPRPYSILIYQPEPKMVVMPGVAGDVGHKVLVNPDWLE